MSVEGKRFATHVGCMDGRVVEPVLGFAKTKFGTDYVDTITDAGIVRIIAHNPTPKFLDELKYKLGISLQNHESVVIIVEGHEQCAGNPVDEETHKSDIIKSVEVIKSLVGSSIPIIGVYVKRKDEDWVVEEIPQTEIV